MTIIVVDHFEFVEPVQFLITYFFDLPERILGYGCDTRNVKSQDVFQAPIVNKFHRVFLHGKTVPIPANDLTLRYTKPFWRG